MVSCILLAAGLSQRFGSPKALARFNGETVIARLQAMLVASRADEIVIVLGAFADEIKPHLLKHGKIRSVHNKDFQLGQTSSFKTGLRAVSDGAQGILLLPVDYPLLQKDTVDQLIDHFTEHSPLILVPVFDDRKGHPPLFSRRLRTEMLALENSQGINSIEHAHSQETVLLPVNDPGVLRAFNTQDEFEEIRRSL